VAFSGGLMWYGALRLFNGGIPAGQVMAGYKRCYVSGTAIARMHGLPPS